MNGWVDVSEIRVNIDVSVVRVYVVCTSVVCVSMLSVYLVYCVYILYAPRMMCGCMCVWFVCVYAGVCLSVVCVCVCAPVQMTADLAFP